MKKMTEKTAPVSPAGLSPANLTHTPVPSPAGHTLYERLRDFDLPGIVVRRLQQADRPFWLAFAAVFLALNLIFLFHGAHFMFGDHDWKYLKHGISLGAGLFEGRFSQFVPVTLLSRGEILPVINNALGFAGFALGVAMLTRYWRLPHTKTACVLFALFAALTPYVLSFMYFAFLVIPVLGWNMFVIGSLLISEKEERFSLRRTVSAAVLTTLALGGYPPVINLIAVAFSVRLLFAALFEIPSPAAATPGTPLPLSLPAVLKTLCRRFRWTAFNLVLGAACYKLCLWALTLTGAVNASYYNLQTTPLAEWGAKFLLVSRDALLQFSATLPFIPAAYKAAAGIVVLAGIAAALLRIFAPFRTNAPAALSAASGATVSASVADTAAAYKAAAGIVVLAGIAAALLRIFAPFRTNAPAALSAASGATVSASVADTAAANSDAPDMPYSFSAGAKIFVIMLLAAVFYAPLVTLFISTSLAETEFSPRIDFFGLMYLYAAMFALTLKNAASAAPVAPAAAPCAITRPAPCAITRPAPCAAVFCKNLAVLGAAAAAAIAVNCLFEAQKVWKLGFDAEMKLYRRAAARFMSSPDFSPGHRYIMVQGGSPAFRPRFYHTPYHYGSDDLLGISYVPGMNPSVMWNYYGVAEYADPSAYVYTFRPDAAAAAAIGNARPWPAPQSTLVQPAASPAGQNIILLILSPEGLSGLKSTYGL